VMREAGGTLNTLAIAQRVAAKKHLDESLVKTVRVNRPGSTRHFRAG
jgi:hypothetical protein